MIVKGMSDSEILKELKSIDAIIKSRELGYVKKFRKELNSKAYKHNDVLAVREYVINWNRVLVCFQKIVLTDKLASLGISHIVLTEDNGAFLSFERKQGCPTLSDPMDCSPPGSSVHGIFQARLLEWGAIAFSDQRASYAMLC